jgi:hypothetical protein
MKTLEEFITSMVKIEFVEDSNCFGHYPFQLFCENKDSEFEINALLLGGDVESCYRRFSDYKKDDAKRIYLSLDFPSGGDIENDFVAIFSLENNEVNLYAIPYETEEGKTFDMIKNSSQLDMIKSQFLSYLKL